MTPTGEGLDPIDRALLQLVQDDFPLDPRPFRAVGERLGLAEREVLERLDRLCRSGVLERIGPVLEATRTGTGASTLVALRLDDDRIDEVAGIVNACDGVSHNYRRDHEYSLWFTLGAPDAARLDAALAGIRDRAGIPETDVLDLRTADRFKVDVRFRFDPGGGR